MTPLTSEQIAALGKRHVKRSVFVHVDALDIDGVTPYPVGAFDDVGSVTVDGRLYRGSQLVSVSQLSAGAEMVISRINVMLSGLPPEVAALVRGGIVAQRAMDVHVGIFDTANHTLIGPLIRRFKGIVDDVEINTPEAGGVSTVVLICESVSRALTIRRYETRSEASEKQRDPNDRFYGYTHLQRKPIPFGQKNPT